MRAQRVWIMGGAVFVAALLSVFVMVQPNGALGASAQSKPVKIHRFFTGPRRGSRR